MREALQKHKEERPPAVRICAPDAPLRGSMLGAAVVGRIIPFYQVQLMPVWPVRQQCVSKYLCTPDALSSADTQSVPRGLA